MNHPRSVGEFGIGESPAIDEHMKLVDIWKVLEWAARIEPTVHEPYNMTIHVTFCYRERLG